MEKSRASGKKIYSPRRQERYRRTNGRVVVVNRLDEYCIWAEYIACQASLLAILTNFEKACKLAQIIAVKRDLAFNRNRDIVK